MARLPHRRTLFVLVLALAGGLATSVSIAWLRAALDGMAWSGNDWVAWHGEESGVVGGHPVPQSGAFVVTERRTTAATDRHIAWVRPPWTDSPPFEEHLPSWSLAMGQYPTEDSRWLNAVEREYGWPVRCVRVAWDFSSRAAEYPGEGLRGGLLIEPVEWGITFRPGVSVTPNPEVISIERHRALPLIPIWGGMALNTLVFATPWLVLALLLALPGVLIRWQRRCRGRCVGCAYPKPDGAPNDPERCPECGLFYHTRLPTWGRWSLGLLTVMVLGLWCIMIGFGVWRVVAREPIPPTHRAAIMNDSAAIEERAALGLPIDDPAPDELRTMIFGLDSTDRPLAWAAVLGHDDALAALIEAGANLDAAGLALRHAARNGRAGACRLLLEAGVDQYPHKQYTEDAFDLALVDGDPQTLTVFYEFTPPADPRRLRAAVHMGIEMLEATLQEREWLDAELEEALVDAARFGRTQAVGVLVSHGVDASNKYQPLLLLAVESGSLPTARALVDAGANGPLVHWVYNGWSPLSRAISLGDLAMFELVLEAGADPLKTLEHEPGMLHLAARTAPVEIVERLIELGLPMDVIPSSGNTPLMDAVEYRRLDVIECLLAAGADPSVPNRGHTALDIARGYKNEYFEVKPAPREIIRVLERAMEPD